MGNWKIWLFNVYLDFDDSGKLRHLFPALLFFWRKWGWGIGVFWFCDMKTAWNLILDKKNWSLEFLYFIPKIPTGYYDRVIIFLVRLSPAVNQSSFDQINWENLLSLFMPLLKLPPGLESNPETSWTEKACVRWEVWLYASLCVYLYARLKKYAWTVMIL